jgi:hypothetical protein
MPVYLLLAIVILMWVIACISSVVAIILLIARRRPPVLPVALALVATAIGYLGFGRWSPFRFFPQIGYTWSSGDFEIRLRSSWFFLVPLALGLAALLLAIWSRRRPNVPPVDAP